MNKQNRFKAFVFLPTSMFQTRKHKNCFAFPCRLLSLLILLLLTPWAIHADTATQFIITSKAQGSGTVSPSGKVVATSGQSLTFSFAPKDEAYEVITVTVDGQPIIPTPTANYTFSLIDKPHTLNVAFAKKAFYMHFINSNPLAGSLIPGQLTKAPYGSSQLFTAKPKNGFRAILKLDGQLVQQGMLNEQISYRLNKITTPHVITAEFVPPNNNPAVTIVRINAIDPHNQPLHYHWKVSEGSIEDVDSPTALWILPPGPGIHFANVLVSNQNGGYAAWRIAVISDDLGTVAPESQLQDFQPITTVGKTYAYDSEFLVAEATDKSDLLFLTRFIYLPDFKIADPTLDGLDSDKQGRIIATPLDIEHAEGLHEPFSATSTHPHTHANYDDYIVGSVRLSDGSLCGTDDKFHGVSSAATATAVDINLNPLPFSAPVSVTVNAYGDYALPWQPDAAQVRIKCESAAPVYVKVNAPTRIATKAILPFGQPIIRPGATAMVAKQGNTNIGIFKSPKLKQLSDLQPSGEKFLGFKGMDTQQQACQYYLSIGAVQNCDGQGNPTGAITFEDWKHKTQMDPYTQAGAEEVKATYINRIDLNLTRRHHAISYADQPGVISVSAGISHSCGLKKDGTLACWGKNSDGQASPPAGKFIPLIAGTLSAGSYHTCGIKTDRTIACWGDNSSGQASPPLGNFNQVSAGGQHTCGIRTNGTLACWGNIDQTNIPGGSFIQVIGGGNFSCGIKADGSLACWGGIDPASIPTGSFKQVSAGSSHACGVKTDNTVVCWGYSGSGQSLPPSASFIQVTGGWNFTCGIKTDGSVACWGVIDPTSIPTGSFSQISAGAEGFHVCGVKTDGTLVCWGNNDDSQSSPPDLKNRVAAYVCNHLGPKTSTQNDINNAIQDAVDDRNKVACVAMDYQAHNGGTPYVRFYVFAPNGQLSLSINLDGRQEKYVPGTCVACHGGDKYDGHFPISSGSPDIGGHFLPYDIGNFQFSSQPDLTKAAQQAAIHQLNNIVMQTNPTAIERTLINAWYASGTDKLDEDYWPKDWQDAAAANPQIEHVYKDVNARYCRTCHVVLNRDGMGSGGSNFDNPEVFDKWTKNTADTRDSINFTVCGNSPFLHDNYTMPNSLVTFNLMWKDTHAVNLLQQILGKCSPYSPNPRLAIRH